MTNSMTRTGFDRCRGAARVSVKSMVVIAAGDSPEKGGAALGINLPAGIPPWSQPQPPCCSNRGLAGRSKWSLPNTGENAPWARLFDAPVGGRRVQGFEGNAVVPRIRVNLISLDVERGAIDLSKTHSPGPRT